MSKVIMFPGQGSQYPGMARDLYEQNDKAREVLDQIFNAVDFDLKSIMFEENEQLNQTEYTQPALFAHALAAHAALGVEADYYIGHSLGELPALVAAGVLSLEDGLKVVVKRGELMSQADEGGMAAVIGMDIETLTNLCDEFSTDDKRIAPANLNAPDQVVISGDLELIERFKEEGKTHGARRVMPLNVSGAFHSHLMAPAKEKFAEFLDDVEFNHATTPVVQNFSAKDEERILIIKQNLIEQLVSPVRFVESIEHLKKLGATEFIEVGPKKVLSGLIRKIDRDLVTKNVDTLSDLEGFVHE